MLDSVCIQKGCDRAYCEETETDGAHELAGCHGGGHVGRSCGGVELQCQCFVLLQGAVAVGVCWRVLLSVFTCSAPQ